MPPKGQSKFGKHTTALEVVAGMDLEGKSFFITGANSGIGFETARVLALHGAHVVMGCRNYNRAMAARYLILKEKVDANIDLLEVDNANLESVYKCAEEYIAKGWPLHCLILNAGIVDSADPFTSDGFESVFQVNHLAHFLLTNLLTPLLIASSPSRIVIVASEAHRAANFFKLHPEHVTVNFLSPMTKSSQFLNYCKSKLFNIWHAKALHSRLANKGITVCCLHPGTMSTNIQQNSKALQTMIKFLKPWTKTIEQGAATTVYCAIASNLDPSNGGLYYDNCRPVAPTVTAQNLGCAERLWTVSEEMLEKYQGKS